jgi:hypothetical protein
MMARKVTLTKYENMATGEIYFGYRAKDALIKVIEGVEYMEVTPSILRPKQMWVKLDSLRVAGDVTFDKPKN